MPRIPEDEIERIKRETDLAALVRSRGIELARHGTGHLVGKCPFHADGKDPNLIVTPAKGLWHCMACGAAGNPIQFVQKFDGVSFRHAFELLDAGKAAFSQARHGSGPGRAAPEAPLKIGTVPRLDSPLDPEADDAALMGQVVAYYHRRLLVTPAALDYLASRGLHNDAAIERFRLGFADRTLGLRLPAKNRHEGEAIRTRLQKLGIYRESGREHLIGRVVLPIPGPDGRLKLYGRLIGKPNPGALKHLYTAGPHEGIWNAEALDVGEVILCEAPFDALTFWVNGFKNVTFIFGTECFTDELFEALLSRHVRRVRIAYDADEAGNRAAARDAQRLTAHGIECFRVKFPWGMDANEYAQKVQPAGKSLEILLNSAEWLPPSPEGLRRTSGGVAGRDGSPSRPKPDPDPPPDDPDPDPSRAPAPAPSSSVVAATSLAANETAAKEKDQQQPTAPAAPRPTLERQGPSTLLRAGEYHVLQLGPREYRVGGLDKNNSLEVLKVAVRLRQGENFHLDSFDMTQDSQRRRFIERAAEETGLEKELVKRDLGKLLLALEQAQSERINAALQPKNGPAGHELSAEHHAEALAFLKAPDLIERIVAAFPTCGLAGEALNSLSSYLACTSRKLDKPLAIIIQSTTAAGKSTLMEAVLSMFPEEERVKYSAMTGQSLYYLGETDLKHKILAIVEEEGAEKAGYALKLLQSEGELTIASTGKDPNTGRMETQEYHVEGPVMIFLTTTAVEIDEELLNRCLILTVDESREQTERIHALQRQARTLEGLVAREERKDLLRVLRNAQRLLQPLAVVNPYANELTFTAERTRTRRDHEKYLTLIDAIALLHQHQRPTETRQARGRLVPYVRATLDDIALANRLAPQLLARSLDELPPQTRRAFDAIKVLVRERCESQSVEQQVALFSRGELRARLGWSVTQIRVHLDRLRDLEYIAARYGRPGSAFQYELLTDCREATHTTHIGLLDVEKLRLRCQPDGKKEGVTEGWRTPPRQVPALETSAFALNLTACRERTSGAALAAVVS